MTPIYWATERASASPATQQYLMRFAAIPFGLATVILAYLLARVLFPGDAFLAITVPTFVAFQPQISYEAAMVNNDILCIALVSWMLYLLVVGLRDRFPLRLCAVTGFAFGLALLAKGTSLTAAPLIALAIILGVGLPDVRGWALRGGIVAGVAALISWPWFLFLYRAYGNFDGFDQIAQLQYWNYQHRDKPSIPDLLFNRDFAELRWKETWGEFGWRRIHLSGAMLWAIGIPCLVALAGLVRYAVLLFRSGADVIDPVLRPRQWQRRSIGLLAATVVVAYFAIVQFGTRFELTQARYFFPAINAVALLLMLGLRALIPRQWRTYGQAGVLLALLLLNALIFTQYVVPYWHFSPR